MICKILLIKLLSIKYVFRDILYYHDMMFLVYRENIKFLYSV